MQQDDDHRTGGCGEEGFQGVAADESSQQIVDEQVLALRELSSEVECESEEDGVRWVTKFPKKK